ncbi:CST complex subunit STN1 isoform X2 [Stigmatopora nigra]
MDRGEELPSMLWGLDPTFSAFARLYVKDILLMKESCQVAGIYFYKSHPIFNVDVLGTVVYKKEREDFFCYGVDDGTGVINCMCWKDDVIKEGVACAWSKPTDDAQGGFSLAAELKRLRQAQQGRYRLEIGDLLRIRGFVKTSRRQREILAFTYYKVDDPVMSTQIEWMFSVLELYREFYDKPLDLRGDATSEAANSSLGKATKILKDFLKQKSVSKFRPYDVEDLLQPVILDKMAPKDQVAVAGPSPGQQLSMLLKEALEVLQNEGIVYRKVRSQDEVYSVTAQDKDLLMAIKDILREDCKREKYREKGCHILHILSAARQRHSLNLTKASVGLVLNLLEANSDIVSTADNYFTLF